MVINSGTFVAGDCPFMEEEECAEDGAIFIDRARAALSLSLSPCIHDHEVKPVEVPIYN